MIRVQTAEQLRAPVQEAERIVRTKFQPVQRLRVTGQMARGMYVIPHGIAVTIPSAAQGVETRILRFQPIAEFLLRRLTITVQARRTAAVVGILVPKVIA